jgi:peptide-methionine (S)-S-oxide reductase
VLRSTVGYTGGTTRNPTYHRLGDHTETVEIEYDPAVISYDELLGLFWRSHDASSQLWSRQYMSAIFYNDEEQKELAVATHNREAAKRGRRIYTEILPAGPFYRAEGYHQKYYLRMRPELVKATMSLYPAEDDFVNSRIAARLNGYLGGYLSLADLEIEISGLGLPGKENQRLLDSLH